MEKPVKNIPDSPGIYKMLDKEGHIIYIGKAKSLKKRVSSYFHKDYEHSTRTKHMLKNTVDIQFIQTDTELEALILESNLIKEHRPRYNILMKDDKSYVYIKVDMNDDFPQIRVVREHELNKDGNKRKPGIHYFGPKLASGKVYETLRILKKIFAFRHCQLDIKWRGGDSAELITLDGVPASGNVNCLAEPRLCLSNKEFVEVKNRVIDFPCLDYSIKRCSGPCIGAISPVEYKKVVQQILDFLSGKSADVENSLRAQMQAAAEKKLFEKAAKIRDKLLAIQSITEKQKVEAQGRPDTDIVNFTNDIGHIYFNVIMIRGGKLINQENFILDALEIGHDSARNAVSEILESFLVQYYEKAANIPKEILIPEVLETNNTLENWLSQSRGDKVAIITPQRGEKNKLLELSLKNAISFAKQYRIKWLAEQQSEGAINGLIEVLGLKDTKLKRIEAFDISHLGGTDTVGSMVVFENGVPTKNQYRHFKIRTITNKPDDYACMEEVLMRRFKYLGNLAADKELKFKQPSKKDIEEIKKTAEDNDLSSDNLDKKTMIAVKRGTKMVGFGRLNKLDEKVTMMASMWVSPAERGKRLGYTIMKKLIARSKLKRVYLNTKQDLEDYYSVFGFTILHDMPEAMKKRLVQVLKIEKGDFSTATEGIISMVYDATKHKVDPSFSSKPDLVVIDGGKGQLGTANLVLKRLKIEIPVISLAKRLEEIFVPGRIAPILLEEGDEALKLLQRLRDEAHRFAITFQRDLHGKRMFE